jgi:predicted PhzF superfamily epimerase YddE/YHI9
MTRSLYQVDAFTAEPFAGNPAAVCLLDGDADPAWMQRVAAEMNLAEAGQELRFDTASGPLAARRDPDGAIWLDFPATPAERVDPPAGLLEALGGVPARRVGLSRFDYLVELADEAAVRDLDPDVRRLQALGVRGVIVTAAGDGDGGHDFVSRFFAPGAGIDEDPVTGSAHCTLAPFWAERLGRAELTGFQASARGGLVQVRLRGDRVLLGGRAVTVLRGQLL